MIDLSTSGVSWAGNAFEEPLAVGVGRRRRHAGIPIADREHPRRLGEIECARAGRAVVVVDVPPLVPPGVGLAGRFHAAPPPRVELFVPQSSGVAVHAPSYSIPPWIRNAVKRSP